MKTKRILGAITAIAMSASAFAGLGTTTLAYEELTDYAIEEISTWTLTGNATNVQTDIFSDLSGTSQTVYAVKGSDNGDRAASYYYNTAATPSTGQALQVDFTLGMASTNSTSNYSYVALMGQNTAVSAGNTYYGSSIAYFRLQGYAGSLYTNDGTSSILSYFTVDADQLSGSYYQRTRLTPIRAIMDFDAHTVQILVADANDDYSEVYSGAMLDTTCTGFYGFVSGQRAYTYNSVTDVSVKTLDKPVLELKTSEATIEDENDGTAQVEVSSLTGSITDVSSTNPNAVTGAYDNGYIVLTGQGTPGEATVTVTVENDGLTTTQDIKVTVGQTSTTTVKVYFKDSTGTITLHDSVEIEGVTVTGDLDLTDVDGTNYVDYVGSTYKDENTGIIYDVTAPTDTDDTTYSSVEEDGEFTLYYTLTEQTYAATVTTLKNASVTISGESTTKTAVNKTVVAGVDGNAVFDGDNAIPAGSGYTVTVSKTDYTTNAAETIDIDNDETSNTANVDITPEKDYVLYSEQFDLVESSTSRYCNVISGNHRCNSSSKYVFQVYNNEGSTLNFDLSGTADIYKITIPSLAFTYNTGATYTNRESTMSLMNGDDTILTLQAKASSDSTTSTLESMTLTCGDSTEEDIPTSGDLVVTLDTVEGELVVNYAGTEYTYETTATGVTGLYFVVNNQLYAGFTSITVEDAAPRIDEATAVIATATTPETTATLYEVESGAATDTTTTLDKLVNDVSATEVTTYTIKVANYASGLPTLTFGEEVETGKGYTLTPAGASIEDDKDVLYYYTSGDYAYFVIQTIGIDQIAKSASIGSAELDVTEVTE